MGEKFENSEDLITLWIKFQPVSLFLSLTRPSLVPLEHISLLPVIILQLWRHLHFGFLYSAKSVTPFPPTFHFLRTIETSCYFLSHPLVLGVSVLSPLLSAQGESANLNLGVKSPSPGPEKTQGNSLLCQTLNVSIDSFYKTIKDSEFQGSKHQPEKFSTKSFLFISLEITLLNHQEFSAQDLTS